jgi:hypothetical protein
MGRPLSEALSLEKNIGDAPRLDIILDIITVYTHFSATPRNAKMASLCPFRKQ